MIQRKIIQTGKRGAGKHKSGRKSERAGDTSEERQQSDDPLLSGEVLKRSRSDDLQVRGLMNEPGAAESGPLLGGGCARP